MNNLKLEGYLNNLLTPEKIKDYCPNGLQIGGNQSVTKIVTGVTATQALIDYAIANGADAILVHHGFFWRNEDPRIIGMKQKRIQALMKHDINLYAYHLPLDIHPTLGNNAQLAKLLGINNLTGLEQNNPYSVAMVGQLNHPVTIEQFGDRITTQLNRKPLIEKTSDTLVSSVALCTGGGQSYIELAAQQGINLFLTGEVSEQTIHVAREMNIHFIAAGHHATERYGVKALGDHLAIDLGLDVQFVDIDNPA